MRQLVTRRWLLTHALVIGMVLLFVRLGMWQLQRGESGHQTSYAYALEWPTFALLVVGFWVKIIHTELHSKTEPDDRTGIRTRRFTRVRDGADTARDSEAAELAAYNRYVADLARQREQR